MTTTMNLNNIDKSDPNSNDTTTKSFEDLFREMPVETDTRCGYSFIAGRFIQRFANKKAFVIVHGILGCMYISSHAYYNGTITTIEKRYGIPSRVTGLIATGYECSAIFTAPLLSYYFAKRNRPRWIAFGMMIVACCFLMNTSLHVIYGPGEDALLLTTEYGATFDINSTSSIVQMKNKKILCQLNATEKTLCEPSKGSDIFPPIYLFLAHFVIGIFAPLYDSLGTSYMDDNMQKSKTPIFISVSYTVRMFGPAFGYTLASFSLQQYIAPDLTPTITQNDPRWLGAWWIGWIVLFGATLIFVFFLSLFPKELPRAHLRRILSEEEIIKSELEKSHTDLKTTSDSSKKSNQMKETFKRVLTNKIFMLNNIAGVFYYFGYLPYWMFSPKYIESQYRQSASTSNLLTGSIAIIFTAIGVIIAGVAITKLKPSARSMAVWNILVGVMSAVAFTSYIFLGCSENDNSIILNQPLNENNTSCMSGCHCDYVKYSPICGEDGNTYISPCHAGCIDILAHENGTKYYKNCSCIKSLIEFVPDPNMPQTSSLPVGGMASSGVCNVNCQRELILFMIVVCLNKFISATGRASNFLVSLRSVNPEDKTVSMGVSFTILCIFALIPSPVVFGWLIDQSCIVWGKTCTGMANCWLYDGTSMRYFINITATIAVVIGTICDCGVWYFVKDLIIFDKETNDDTKSTGNNTIDSSLSLSNEINK